MPTQPWGIPKEGVSSLVTTTREPRAYEIMAVFLPELADEDLTVQLDRAGGYITSVGGTIKEVLTDSPWGRRRLAYPIRFNGEDFRDGYYAVYHFDLEPSAMTDVERELKLDTRVMRYLLVHDDPKAGERNTGRPEADAAPEDEPVSVAATDAAPAASTGQGSDERPSDRPAETPAEDAAVQKAASTDVAGEAPEPDASSAELPVTAAAEAGPAASSTPEEPESDGGELASTDAPSGSPVPEANITPSEQTPAPGDTPETPSDSASDNPEQED